MGKQNIKQMRFTFMVAILILYSFFNGIGLTFGDAYATDGHRDGSFHYKRLAIDLHAFNFKTGEYLKATHHHEKLGRFWKLLGGTWGGDFRKKDGNHYSLGEI